MTTLVSAGAQGLWNFPISLLPSETVNICADARSLRAACVVTVRTAAVKLPKWLGTTCVASWLLLYILVLY